MNISPKDIGEKATTYAYRIILDNIINLELPPGSTVSENELSLILNLSRTPIREALIELSRLGLVEIYPKKGSFVSKIDYNHIEEARFIRLSLENSIIKLACEQELKENYLEKLHNNIEQNRRLNPIEANYSEIVSLDNEFHKLLFESVDKLYAYDLVHSQMVHFDRLRNLSYRNLKLEKLSRTIKDHENILYALEKKDAELGEMVMTKHLERHRTERYRLLEICPDYFQT